MVSWAGWGSPERRSDGLASSVMEEIPSLQPRACACLSMDESERQVFHRIVVLVSDFVIIAPSLKGYSYMRATSLISLPRHFL